MANHTADLAQLKELATTIPDNSWVSIPSSEVVSAPDLNNGGATEILAQCCKPGPCGPKTIGQ